MLNGKMIQTIPRGQMAQIWVTATMAMMVDMSIQQWSTQSQGEIFNLKQPHSGHLQHDNFNKLANLGCPTKMAYLQ